MDKLIRHAPFWRENKQSPSGHNGGVYKAEKKVIGHESSIYGGRLITFLKFVTSELGFISGEKLSIFKGTNSFSARLVSLNTHSRHPMEATMTYIKTLSALGAMSAIMLAPNAIASDASEAPNAAMSNAENAQALDTVETDDIIPVQDEDGNIFYNHYVSDAELFDASIDLKVVDTQTFEYEGRVYTNKIVTK